MDDEVMARHNSCARAEVMGVSHCPQPEGVGAEYGLILPFVVCATAGGPYDDAAFVAGWQAASVDGFLASGRKFLRVAAYSRLAPQLELVAMQRGYMCRRAPWAPDPSWSVFLFMRLDEQIEQYQMDLLLTTGLTVEHPPPS